MKQAVSCFFDTFTSQEELLAVLVDPDKFVPDKASAFLRNIPITTTHIFVGGSTVERGKTDECIRCFKAKTSLPIILFPGDHSQITPTADALLFLSLISGRNPEYLIEQQVRSVEHLRNVSLETIPTGYILLNGGKESAVERVSRTTPLSQERPELIVNTALAGEYLGKKLIYLEAGSGAANPVDPAIIRAVKKEITVPLIVGGGIRSKEQLESAYSAGADLVVVGTAFENGDFFTS